MDFVIGAHLTLDGDDGAVGVGDGLALSHLAYHALAGFGKCHNGRSGPGTFGVGDHIGFAAFNDGHTRVGCTKVDTCLLYTSRCV